MSELEAPHTENTGTKLAKTSGLEFGTGAVFAPQFFVATSHGKLKCLKHILLYLASKVIVFGI